MAGFRSPAYRGIGKVFFFLFDLFIFYSFSFCFSTLCYVYMYVVLCYVLLFVLCFYLPLAFILAYVTHRVRWARSQNRRKGMWKTCRARGHWGDRCWCVSNVKPSGEERYHHETRSEIIQGKQVITTGWWRAGVQEHSTVLLWSKEGTEYFLQTMAHQRQTWTNERQAYGSQWRSGTRCGLQRGAPS